MSPPGAPIRARPALAALLRARAATHARIVAASLACAIALMGCRAASGPTRTADVSSGAVAPTITLRGTFVKLTRWACHMSDNYVGGQQVTFTASDGYSRTITTHSATWVGLPADPPKAPFGNCRQTARYEVRLPVADSYRVQINHYRFPPVTLGELQEQGLRHTFRLPS